VVVYLGERGAGVLTLGGYVRCSVRLVHGFARGGKSRCQPLMMLPPKVRRSTMAAEPGIGDGLGPAGE
jgi:hypothetical protein